MSVTNQPCSCSYSPNSSPASTCRVWYDGLGVNLCSLTPVPLYMPIKIYICKNTGEIDKIKAEKSKPALNGLKCWSLRSIFVTANSSCEMFEGEYISTFWHFFAKWGLIHNSVWLYWFLHEICRDRRYREFCMLMERCIPSTTPPPSPHGNEDKIWKRAVCFLLVFPDISEQTFNRALLSNPFSRLERRRMSFWSRSLRKGRVEQEVSMKTTNTFVVSKSAIKINLPLDSRVNLKCKLNIPN